MGKYNLHPIKDLAKFPEENPNPIMRIAGNGVILYANPASQPLLSNWDCHAGDYVPQDIRQLIPEIMESGKNKEIDVLEGTQIFQLALVLVPGQDYINIYGRNVTVRRRAVEALMRAHAELETKVKERTVELQKTNEILQKEILVRKRAEEEAKYERQRFFDLLEMLPVYVILLTPDHHVPFANKFFRERFGESNGKRCFDYLFGRTEPCDNCEAYRVLETGSPHRWEWTDPDSRNYDIYDFLFTDTDGSKLIMEMGIDITDQKKAESELRRSNTELQQFAYITSHDMQEPLRMITSYLQLIEKRYKNKLDADADEFIGYAVDGATRMRNMINDLLEYSRIQTRGKEFEQVNSEHTLDTALSNLEVTIKENKATVTHDPLPVITADPTQFVQLIQNLIANAVKFHGGTLPEVRISAKKEGSEWVFSVKDNGIGIDPQQQGRIFNIFQRLHTREEYPGTGIGLAVCKRIVERHGGRIWVESQPGQGATFYFTFPDRVR